MVSIRVVSLGGMVQKIRKRFGKRGPDRYTLRMIPFICLLLATAPLAISFLFGQLNDDNYQFSLPYLACLAWLGWDRFQSVSFRTTLASWWDWSLVVGIWLVCAGATILNYPRGAFFGFFLSLILVGRLLLDSGSLGRILPVLLAGFVVIPPPFGFLDTLTSNLQTMVVAVCHHVLLSMDLFHRVTGNVILLPDRPLLVAEACSGIRSLVSIAALSICYSLFQERSWQRAIGLFITSVIVVTILNVFRILFIVLVIHYQKIDFTMGLKHEILGFALFASGLIVILGTDQLFEGLREWLVPPKKVAFSDDDNQVAAEAVAPSVELLLGYKPKNVIAPLGVLCWVIPVLFVPLGLLEAKILASQSFRIFGAGEAVGHLRLQVNMFKGELDGWKLLSGPEIVEDSKLLGQGIQSQFWIFGKGGLVARLAIDEPFHGFHNLAFCYRNVGWEETGLVESIAKEGRFRVEANYFKPPNRRLFLLFGHVDTRGNWLQFETALARYWGSARDRISENFFTLGSTNPLGDNYQIQLSCQSNHELSGQQKTDLCDLYEEARETIGKWPSINRSN